jgi:hypothetical protein
VNLVENHWSLDVLVQRPSDGYPQLMLYQNAL